MKFFRYEIVQYASMESDSSYKLPIISNPNVILREFNLHKETAKGYWIGYGSADEGLKGTSIWVSKSAKKRYAYPTKKEALTNFIKRNELRVKILRRQLETSEHAIIIAKNL